jgi:TIR domain
MKVFISYAHHDQAMLERLHAHLAMLRREGGIAEWYDRDILAGGAIDREIAFQLNASSLFLALVSPDFLNSQYCYESEMQAAIRKHDNGEIIIVPIILEPCDWLFSPLKQFKALPQNGKPITEWTNQNEALLDVVTELRRLVQSVHSAAGTAAPLEPPAHQMRTQSKYRAKKSFDELDRDEFRRAAFEAIKDYFEKSAREIDRVEGLSSRYETLGPLSFTCSVVNHVITTGRGSRTHYCERDTRITAWGHLLFVFRKRSREHRQWIVQRGRR